MTQEDKELLLKDLCARIPYGVKADIKHRLGEDTSLLTERLVTPMWLVAVKENVDSIKPYLRPMSSMTEEEGDWCNLLLYHKEDTLGYYDYLNSIHVDYRGLIEMGLAIEAPEGMYDTKQ